MKEVERLRRDMEEDEQAQGLADDASQDEQEEKKLIVEGDIDEQPRSSNSTEVHDDTEFRSPLAVPKDSPESTEIEGTWDIPQKTEGDAATDIDETGRSQSKTKGSKGKNKPLSPELPTKTVKYKYRPVPDIILPDTGGDTLTDSTISDRPQTELSKREKRRLREAKKAREGQTASSCQACNVCKEQFESKTKLFAHINSAGHALASAAIKDNEADRMKKGRKGNR